VWNQLEAAMAFGLRLPLLVIIEKGLTQEAMLKDRLEYRALVTKFERSFLKSEEFKGIFADWKRKAQARPPAKTAKIDGLTVGKLLQELPPDQLWKVGGALVSSLVGIAGVAFGLGKALGGP
jgi:hypothetical protein